MYTSAAGSSVHVYLLSPFQIQQMFSKEVKLQCYFSVAGAIFGDIGVILDCFFRGRRIIWCGCSVNFHGMRLDW